MTLRNAALAAFAPIAEDKRLNKDESSKQVLHVIEQVMGRDYAECADIFHRGDRAFATIDDLIFGVKECFVSLFTSNNADTHVHLWMYRICERCSELVESNASVENLADIGRTLGTNAWDHCECNDAARTQSMCFVGRWADPENAALVAVKKMNAWLQTVQLQTLTQTATMTREDFDEEYQFVCCLFVTFCPQ